MDKDDIELRSEKVSNIIGGIPPVLQRKGIVLIICVIFLIIAATYFLPYIESIKVDICMSSQPASYQYIAKSNGVIHLNSTLNNQDLKYPGSFIGYILSEDNTTTKLFTKDTSRVIWNCSEGMLIKKGDVVFATIPDTINSIYAIAEIPNNYINRIYIDQGVMCELQEYSISLNGRISHIFPLRINSKDKFRVKINFPSTSFLYSNAFKFTPGIKGEAEITISEKTILEKLISH